MRHLFIWAEHRFSSIPSHVVDKSSNGDNDVVKCVVRLLFCLSAL